MVIVGESVGGTRCVEVLAVPVQHTLYECVWEGQCQNSIVSTSLCDVIIITCVCHSNQ